MLNDKQVALFLLAIENLDKEIGEWTDEAIIEHLKSNSALARNYMERVLEENDNINAKGITPKAEQVYALIKAGTRYEEQCRGQHFPVRFELSPDGYHWKGGLGGRYRMSDLNLYKKNDQGEFVYYPSLHNEEPYQVITLTLNQCMAEADRGELCSDWFTRYSNNLIRKLEKIKTKACETYVVEEDE